MTSSWFFLPTLFTTLSSLILSTYSSHHNLPFFLFISVTTSNSPYLHSPFVLLLQYPATRIGPNIFLSTFLSQIRKFFSSFAAKHRASEPYRNKISRTVFYTHETKFCIVCNPNSFPYVRIVGQRERVLS